MFFLFNCKIEYILCEQTLFFQYNNRVTFIILHFRDNQVNKDKLRKRSIVLNISDINSPFCH